MCVCFREFESNSCKFLSFSFHYASLLCQHLQYKENFPFGLNANIWITKKWRDSPVRACFLSASFFHDPLLFLGFNLSPPLKWTALPLDLSTFYLFFPRLPVSYRLHILAFPQLISCIPFICWIFQASFFNLAAIAIRIPGIYPGIIFHSWHHDILFIICSMLSFLCSSSSRLLCTQKTHCYVLPQKNPFSNPGTPSGGADDDIRFSGNTAPLSQHLSFEGIDIKFLPSMRWA